MYDFYFLETNITYFKRLFSTIFFFFLRNQEIIFQLNIKVAIKHKINKYIYIYIYKIIL